MRARSKSPRRSSGGARARKSSPGKVNNRSPGSQYRTNVVHVEELRENSRPVRYECTSTGIISNPTRILTSKETAESYASISHSEDLAQRPASSAIAAVVFGWLYKIFLPEGYPRSVSSDYLPYQIWDTIQAFCSTVTGILASKSALAGLGVGNVEARVGAALYFAIVKRNIGKVSRIAFTTLKGSDLDNNAKTWRVVADVLNDLASALELLAPWLCVAGSDCSEQWHYSLLVIAAEVFRSVVGVAGGASRAALTQHFAVKDNFGDVNAKDGSQEMFVEIVGSFVGLQLSHMEGKGSVFAFALFTLFHIAANVQACRAVALLTLNRQRAHILCSHFLLNRAVRTPAQVAAEESVAYFGGSGVRGTRICMGATLPAIAAACDVPSTIRKSARANYLVGETTTSGALSMRREILVGFHVDATSEDFLRGYMHAFMLAKGGFSTEQVVRKVDQLLDILPAYGWRLDAAHVGPGTTRLSWDQDQAV